MKTKRRIFIILIFIIGILVIWKKLENKNIAEASKPSLSEQSESDSDFDSKTEDKDVKLDHLKSDEIDPVLSDKKNDNKSNQEVQPRVLFERDKSISSEVSYNPQKLEDVFAFLENKKREEPLAEFSKLHDFAAEVPRDLKEGESFRIDAKDAFNFVGLYIDRTVNIKLFLFVDIETGQLGEQSCLIVKDEVYQNQNGFQIRLDGNGYAVILVDSKWYLRMKYVDDYGHLVGHLYKLSENGWLFQESFDAFSRKLVNRPMMPGSDFCHRIRDLKDSDIY